MQRAHCARAWSGRGRQAGVCSTAASAVQVPGVDKVGLRLQTWIGRQPRRGDVDVDVDGDGDGDVDGDGASNSCTAGAKRVDTGQAGAAGHGRGRLAWAWAAAARRRTRGRGRRVVVWRARRMH